MMNYEILSWSTFKFWELSYFKEIYANLACVAGVSKNLREGSETAQEGVRKIRSRGRGWGELRIPFLPTPSPLVVHPLPTSPQFFAQPRRAPSLARVLRSLVRSPPGKGKERKRLLRRLMPIICRSFFLHFKTWANGMSRMDGKFCLLYMSDICDHI